MTTIITVLLLVVLFYVWRHFSAHRSVTYNLFKEIQNESADVERIKSLIELGADVNAKVQDGWTVLMAASYNQNPQVIKILLEAGADVNASSNEGETALMVAVLNKNSKVTQTLLEAGANVNAKTQDGNTALMLATSNENLKVVKTLLAFGADVNDKDNFGLTAFALAADNKNPEIAIALLKAGSDISLKTQINLHNLHSAEFEGIKKSILNSNDLFRAIMSEKLDLEYIRSLIQQGEDVNAKDDERLYSFNDCRFQTRV